MKLRILSFAAINLVAAAVLAQDFEGGHFRSGIDWKEPAKITSEAVLTPPPSDAIVLFDGTNLDAWEGGAWKVSDGILTTEPGTGDIRTKEKFGSVQLHLEFTEPPVKTDENGNPTRRAVRLDLQAAPAAGERLQGAGRVAKLRYYLPSADFPRRERPDRRSGPAGNHYRFPKRCAGDRQLGNPG